MVEIYYVEEIESNLHSFSKIKDLEEKKIVEGERLFVDYKDYAALKAKYDKYKCRYENIKMSLGNYEIP